MHMIVSGKRYALLEEKLQKAEELAKITLLSKIKTIPKGHVAVLQSEVPLTQESSAEVKKLLDELAEELEGPFGLVFVYGNGKEVVVSKHYNKEESED